MYRRWHSARKDRRRRKELAAAGIAVECEVSHTLYGARSGVWPWPLHQEPGAIVYSIGVGNNAAWEREVIARHGAHVHGFDPTPGAVAWVREQGWPPEFAFEPVGLGVAAGEIGFRAPRKGCNYVPLAPDDPGPIDVRAPVAPLDDLMAARGHARLDVLKIDIEGGEYAVLRSLDHDVPAHTLLIEFHHDQSPFELADTTDAIAGLRARGLRCFWISERGLEFGLCRDA